MPHGREHAAEADRTTNANETDDGGDRPWNSRSRTPRSSCSRKGNGSSSAAATVVASGVPSVAAASVTSVGDHDQLLTVAVAIQWVTDLAALAAAVEVSVPGVARAKPESVFWGALAKDCDRDVAVAEVTAIGNADYDCAATGDLLRHRCHIGRPAVVVCPGHRPSRNRSCWHRPRCTFF